MENERNVRVSVIVTAFNHESYIRQCIDSVLMQRTDFPIEIIIGEDDSSDATRRICKEYAESHPDKVRLILHHRENVISILNKPTGRFNFLYSLSIARGEYIALCDGDDFWTDPLKLQKQYDVLSLKPDCSICFHEVKSLKGVELSVPKGHRPPSEISGLKDLAFGNYIHTVSCMFKAPEELPEWLLSTPTGDYPLHLYNASKGDIAFLNDDMAVYRIHEDGVWSSLDKEEIDMRWIYQLILIRPYFSREVQEVLTGRIKSTMGSMLAESHVQISRLKGAVLKDMLTAENSNSELVSLRERLENEFSKNRILRTEINSDYISRQFSVSEIISAVFLKIKRRVGSV